MDILVSVITVSFNSEKTIKRTIESVLCQTYANVEYIIIDGDSSDSTVSIARSYIKQFEDKGYTYTIISEPDSGIYDAMNKGISLANGVLIGIINSDDWYEDQAIETAATAYNRDLYDYFYASINIWGDTPSGLTLKFVKQPKCRRLVVSRDWNHPSSFVTKRLYNELGTFKLESLHDDWDFYLRTRKANKKIFVEDEILANFVVGGESNKKSFKTCLARGKARYKIYRDNGYSRLYWIECVLIEAIKYVLI